MRAATKPAWVNRVHFLLLLAIIVTTVFSWLNLNSYCIILTLLFIFVTERQQVIEKIKQAFADRLYLGFFGLFLLECIGLLYTDNLPAGLKNVEPKATLLAIPFIIRAGPFANAEGYKKIMIAFCSVLFPASVICLGIAISNYMALQDISVFFYHDLVNPLQMNAVLFSIFMIAGLLFLAKYPIHAGKYSKPVRNFLIAWFIAFTILLASKLMLLILAFLLLLLFFKKFPPAQHKKAAVLILLVMVGGILLIAATDNPIRKRYEDIIRGDIDLVKREQFSPDMYFNGVQLRLLEWRFTFEILREHNAWLLGVTPGDAQDLLNEKYISTNMYTGTPERNDTGFLGYDTHNQYLQYQLQSGVIGLIVFLLVCGTLIKRAAQQGTIEAAFITGSLLVVCLTEALLEMQHGLFLFSFFPFLLRYNPGNKPAPSLQQN